jgi:tetratricopeptide (TPR) repeat protein
MSMNRPAPVALTTFVFASIALFAIDATRLTAYTANCPSVEVFNRARSTAIQKKEPAKRKTGSSGEKSRNLVHKATESAQRAIGTPEKGPQSFAVVIGISAYKNLPEQSQLRFADKDATAIRDFLVGPNGGFSSEHVDLLVNDQADRASIIHALENLQNTASPEDLAFIFFAGHGIVKASQGFLLAYDSQPKDLLLTAVDMDLFNSVIRSLRARSVVIFTDACHSGTIGDLANQPGTTEPASNLTAKNFADTSARTNQTSFIFSAASPSQSSWELGPPVNHGLFTHHVLGGLGGKADRNGNGVVTADELYDYVVNNVRQDAKEKGYSQVPEFNPRYDRSIPLSFLDEAGQRLYRDWFDSDPFTARYSASFYEALNQNFLIKPELESAWYYYNAIRMNGLRTPPESIKKMREELRAKLISSSQTVFDQSPSDPLVWEEAAAFLGRAHELYPEDRLRAEQAFCKAMAAHYSRENGRAEIECDIALTTIKESNLKEPPLCFKIAQLYKSLQKLDKARESYKLAIDGEPRVDWICEYAEVLKQLKDLPEAESQLRFSRAKNAQDPNVLRLLAEVLVMEGLAEQISEAVDIAREARQIKPNDVDIEEVFGWALLKAGKPREAVDPLRKVAELRLDNDLLRDKALLQLGQAYADSGDLDRSVSALREAERRGSKLPEIYDELSKALEQQGDLDGAISAARHASDAMQSTGEERAKRVRRVAEYLERTGKLDQAALAFKDAARLSAEVADVKGSSSLTAHATVLSYRVERLQDTPPVRKRAAPTRRMMRGNEVLIIPGGREPLKRLTGVTIEPSGEAQALAVIFDTCLRDSAFKARLLHFYEKYHDLIGRLQGKGFGTASGSLTLPAASKPHTPAANEALDFFQVEDKNGKRRVKSKEFESRKFVLEALGGDPDRLERGEETLIKFNNNDEWSVPLGVDRWVGYVKDMAKARPEDRLREFLKDDHAMRFYVGLSALPDDSIEEFADKVITRESWKDISAAVYFVAPFLRFAPDGHLQVPGQRGGEINWQRLLKTDSVDNTWKNLFRKDKAEALYLFAALSSAGDVGDVIARSPKLLDDFYRLLKDSSLPAAREPFDLIDLLSFVRVEGDKLRLPPAVELWLTADRVATDRRESDRKDTDPQTIDRNAADPIATLIRQIEKNKVGRTIPLVRLIAGLDHIGRELPDWVADVKLVDLLVEQIRTGRESQLELALDLELSREQVELYLNRITRVEAISTPAQKQATACVYQAALELLRIAERRGVVQRAKITEATDLLLELDPGSELFASGVITILRTSLLGAPAPLSGQEFETQLIAVLAVEAPYVLQNYKAATASDDPVRTARFYQFDPSRPAQERIRHNLDIIRHTRLRAVINAGVGLDVLEKSSSDSGAIQQLQAALAEFILPEPPPPPKKSRSKQPTVSLPTIKEIAEQLSAPIPPNTIEDLRRQIAPFYSQALLGVVYAAESYPAPKTEAAYASLVLNHDMTADAWGNAEFDLARKSVRGGLPRLGYALTNMESSLFDPTSPSTSSEASTVELVSAPGDRARLVMTVPGKTSMGGHVMATLLNSFDLVNHRLQTRRAAEFVSRSIDLGEDVLGLFMLRDATARTVIDELDQQLTPRRAHALRASLEGSEIKKALTSLSLSELYAIGQRYFAARMTNEPLMNLAGEPGALGVMARVLTASRQNVSETEIPEDLRREIRQLGLTMTTRTGLMRLDLRLLEPYEQSLTVEGMGRLIERLQDFKLAVARTCYRAGPTPSLAFGPFLVRAAIDQALVEMGKDTGRTPPDRDWQSLLRAIQTFDQATLNAFIEELMSSSYASLVTGAAWGDGSGGVQ